MADMTYLEKDSQVKVIDLFLIRNSVYEKLVHSKLKHSPHNCLDAPSTVWQWYCPFIIQVAFQFCGGIHQTLVGLDSNHDLDCSYSYRGDLPH